MIIIIICIIYYIFYTKPKLDIKYNFVKFGVIN